MSEQLLLVSGSRDWTDVEAIQERIALWSPDTAIVAHGAARGADAVADRVARAMGYGVLSFPADWDNLGNIAGPIRNQEMVEYARDLNDKGVDIHLLAFPKPQSRGTIDMIGRCEDAEFLIHDVRDWTTGSDFSRFRGMTKYMHIVRAHSDPERGPRRAGTSTDWIQYTKAPPEDWKMHILQHLSDGVARTFNRIAVELTDKTADVLSGKSPDRGLWMAVHEGTIEHTITTPILFRRVRA